MGGLSPIHWIIVIGVAAVLFGGRGKLSNIMGDAAKGIRAFKDGLKDENVHDGPALGARPRSLAAPPVPPATPATAVAALRRGRAPGRRTADRGFAGRGRSFGRDAGPDACSRTPNRCS